MRKIFTFMMTLAVAFCISACGSTKADDSVVNNESNVSTEDKSETITIQAQNANNEMVDMEVPYNPQRIAILDMAALDIVDALGVGDRVVGSAKVTIEYLTDYNPDDSNGAIMNLGTVKTADLEAIAPVVYLAVDYEKGIVESTKANTQTIASIFGKEADVDAMFTHFQPRIDTLNTVLNGKDVLLGMYNSNALGLMDTESQLNIIAKELGANNLGETVGEVEKATHGEEASWETIITLDPEYMFIPDRSTATGGIQALDTMLADLEGALLNETF